MVERKEETAMKKEYLDKIAEYGQLIVVSGPSGVGNKTVLREYLQDHEQACVSVSVTTRRQREHEIDGKDYWFVSVPEFERMVRMGEMLEYTYVNGNAYGTTKKSVEEARAKGKNVILDVDTIGAMKIRALCPDATLIYILPPSWDELKSRLSSTGIYNEEEVNALMEIAEEEISCANSYDYILVNDTISNTLSRFAQIIHSNRYSRNCMKEFLDSYIDGEVKPHVQSYTLLQNLALLYLYCDTILLLYHCHAYPYIQHCFPDNYAGDMQSLHLDQMQSVLLSFPGIHCQTTSEVHFLSGIQGLLQ